MVLTTNVGHPVVDRHHRIRAPKRPPERSSLRSPKPTNASLCSPEDQLLDRRRGQPTELRNACASPLWASASENPDLRVDRDRDRLWPQHPESGRSGQPSRPKPPTRTVPSGAELLQPLSPETKGSNYPITEQHEKSGLTRTPGGDHSGPFTHHGDLTRGGKVAQAFRLPAGPAHHDVPDRFAAPGPEVHPWIV